MFLSVLHLPLAATDLEHCLPHYTLLRLHETFYSVVNQSDCYSVCTNPMFATTHLLQMLSKSACGRFSLGIILWNIKRYLRLWGRKTSLASALIGSILHQKNYSSGYQRSKGYRWKVQCSTETSGTLIQEWHKAPHDKKRVQRLNLWGCMYAFW